MAQTKFWTLALLPYAMCLVLGAALIGAVKGGQRTIAAHERTIEAKQRLIVAQEIQLNEWRKVGAQIMEQQARWGEQLEKWKQMLDPKQAEREQLWREVFASPKTNFIITPNSTRKDGK